MLKFLTACLGRHTHKCRICVENAKLLHHLLPVPVDRFRDVISPFTLCNMISTVTAKQVPMHAYFTVQPGQQTRAFRPFTNWTKICHCFLPRLTVRYRTVKPRLHQIQVFRTSNLYPDTSGYNAVLTTILSPIQDVDGDRRYKWIQVDTTCIRATCIRCKRGIMLKNW